MKFLKHFYNIFKFLANLLELRPVLFILSSLSISYIFLIIIYIYITSPTNDYELLSDWNKCTNESFLGFELHKNINSNISVKCRIFKVNINWNKKSEKKDKINFFVKKYFFNKNISNIPERVYVLIAGGPGQTSRAFDGFAMKLAENQKNSVVITFDHRGVGRSNELECSSDDPAECNQELLNKYGENLDYFSSYQAAKDLKFLLENQFNGIKTTLYGVSYGTILEKRVLDLNIKQIDTYIFNSVVSDKISNLDYENTMIRYFKSCLSSYSCKSSIKNISYNSFKNTFDFIQKHGYCFNNNKKINIESMLNDYILPFPFPIEFVVSNFLESYSDIDRLNEFISGISSCDRVKIFMSLYGKKSSYSKAILPNINCREHSIISNNNEYYTKNIYCKNTNGQNKFVPDFLNYYKNSKNKFLIISGELDGRTPNRGAKDLYNILPNNTIYLSINKGFHDPINDNCATNLIAELSNNGFINKKYSDNVCLKKQNKEL